MDKLKLAHEYALKQMESLSENSTMQSLVSVAWQYADAMQAEADKRKQYDPMKKVREQEWQPDWSQAPDNMTHFEVDKNGSGWFFNREPRAESDCCWYCGDDSAELDNHNYQGNWQDSLRKRPSNI